MPRNPCILVGPQQRGRKKSEVATSTLPSQGPKRGRNCYVTPAFSGAPNTKRGDKIRSGCLAIAFSELAFALGARCAVDKPPLVDEVRPKCGGDPW